MPDTVLVIDDDPILRGLLVDCIRDGDLKAIPATGTKEALSEIEHHSIQLILLDLHLQDGDGMEFCRLLKKNSATWHIPVVIISGDIDDLKIIEALEAGADDYITKPFNADVFFAKVRSMLRRQGKKDAANNDQEIEVDGMLIHPGKMEVRYGDERLQLNPTEFRILHFLAQHPGWVFTRDKIHTAVNPENLDGSHRAVDIQVASLRKKLGSHAGLIETVRGVGYRFRDPD